MEYSLTGFVDTHVNDDVHPIFNILTPVNAAVRQMLLAWRNNTTHAGPSLSRFPYRLIEIVHVVMTMTRYRLNLGQRELNIYFVNIIMSIMG